MKTKLIVASAGGALLIAASIFSASAIGTSEQSPTPAVSTIELDSQTIAPATPTTAATVPIAEPATVTVEQAPVPVSPTLCPDGTTAGAVDSAGNESNCQNLGPGGQPCVEYNVANQCVAWYKP